MAGQNTTLSLFLVNAVHATPVLVGLFFTARAASGMVASLVTGWVSDRMRDRRVIIGVTSLAGAAGTLCLALLRDYALLLLSGVVFASIGTGAFGQMFAYANEFATARGRDVTFFMSVVRSVFSAAYIVGPPLGLFIMMRAATPAYAPLGPISGSSGHKITARAAAARMAVPSTSARVSAAPYSGQDATKITGPSGGSGCTQKLPSHRRSVPPLLPCSTTRRPGSTSRSGRQ
jgi:MFS transporter, SET family, sugar efflux transporter